MAKKREVATRQRGTVAKATDTAAREGSQLLQRATPYLPPWVAAGVLPPAAGWATHEMWGQDPTSAGLACAALAVGGAVLSTVTWQVAGGNNKFRRARRIQATASTAAAMGWLTMATATGPFESGVLDSWLIGGGLFAATWNIRQLMRNAHDETEPAETEGGWGRLAEAIGLEKFKISRAKGNDKGVVTAEVGVPAGKTVEDAQAAAGRLAAATHVPPSGVTITRNEDDAAVAHLKLRVADMLKDGVPFFPPIELGLLPTEPIPVGLYADNEGMAINPFAAEILQHLLVMGVTGAGKSEFARTVLTHLMTRRKLSIVLVDLAKGEQTVGHIKQGLDWFITTTKEARHLVRGLPRAIKVRGDVLAAEGLDQWTPDSSLNAMVVWMEEAADLVDFDELDKIARAARSVGIWLVISLQRATWTNMSTDVRANLQASACFGVDDPCDAGYCLPDAVTESGAVPAWGSDRPGYAYATGMGIPRERWTTEWRGSLTDREVVAVLVDMAAPVRDPLDEVTAEAFGLAYAQRQHRGTNRATHPAPATPAGAGAAAFPAGPGAAAIPTATEQDMTNETNPDHIDVLVDDGVDQEVEEMQDREAVAAAWDGIMGAIPPDPEPDAAYARVQLEDDCPEPDPDTSLTFEQADRPSTDEARHILYTQFDAWVQQEQLTFETGDLIPAAVAAGRKRGWLQNELKRLVSQGVLQHTAHGEYTIISSPLVPA